jgi:glycine cleavage system H protein
MSNVPENLKYTKTHEWVQVLDDGTITVGITDHAQDQLGDMVFIELPETGTTLNAGEDCAVVESVKAASDVYTPVSGEIIAANENIVDSPELVNKDPYGDGWIFRIKPSDESDMDNLLSASDYSEFVATEESE